MSSSSAEHTAWTAPGSDTAAKNTYASIRTALKEIEQRRDVEIFLQGSYANSTNIRADSDVDIVVMTRLAFQASVERMGPTTRAAWDSLPAATFQSSDLRSEVLAALISYYGASAVHARNKCIKVDSRPGYADADVVPSVQYRWLPNQNAGLSSGFVEGIAIHPLAGGRIVNFPKLHIANGNRKSGECLQRYKATVRQMKRLRNRAVEEGRLRAEDAPGYLLECMTYNVPADQFVSDDSKRLSNVVLWLKYTDKSGFLACDGIHRLFVDDPGKFDVVTAQRIVDALWEAY